MDTKTRLGADCGSDHELLIAKFRLKLKKEGKITKPYRYDPNQTPYDYIVKVKSLSCVRLPGNSTGVDCLFLLHGIFPTQGSNLGLPYCRQMLKCLIHQGSPQEKEM